MNGTHLHLIFTHLPLVGLGFALLVHLYAIYRKNPEIMTLSRLLYILVGVASLLAYLTGDGAEEIMKTYPGVTEDMTELHEHFALAFLIGTMVTACLSMAGLYFSSRKEFLVKKTNLVTLIVAILICIVAVETAITGGQIRHTEFRDGAYKEVKSEK